MAVIAVIVRDDHDDNQNQLQSWWYKIIPSDYEGFNN